jgi:ornithine cyclodeaminase/alanine dehydrogenase
MPLLLTRQDVESLLTMRATIQIVENTLRELALGHVIMPQQTKIHLPGEKGVYRVMPAYIGGEVEGLGCQILASHSDNLDRHRLPAVVGTLILNDPETGVPLAIMDASFLTAMRSGASSAVATKYLARQEVNEVTVFGTGTQACFQLMGVCAVRNVNGAVVLDPDDRARHRFADEMTKALDIPVQPVQDVRAAVEMADVIITAGHSREPLFQGEWIHAGLHINAVGIPAPDAREIDSETMRRAKLVPELTSACLAEAGDFFLPLQEGTLTEEHIHADLGQVIAGLKPGRENDDEITLFKSVGLAAPDIAIAIHVYRLARRRRVGKTINL